MLSFREKMGLYSDVDKATDENNTSEEWGVIMEICDKAGKSSQEAKEYLKAILRRINHEDPHVAIQGVTLLDACVKNCGKTFHIEVASRDFENEYIKLIKKTHPTVKKKLLISLKKWAEGEFKSDQQLSLIKDLYVNLKSSGYNFNTEEQPKKIVLSKDPNVVQSQEEEDQIAKAIELSLRDTSGSPRNAAGNTSNSLYPSANLSLSTNTNKELRKVRALYDFEAAEDNELTFNTGDIIFVLDDSDANWWKGKNLTGEGLFPSNFVTADLSMDPQQLELEKQKKLQQVDESWDKQLEDMKEPKNVEINEDKIDRLLHLLHEADPTNPDQDTKEMLTLEREVNSMGGLIDKELERVDRKHAQLTQLSGDLVEALNLYHSLMREPQHQFNNLPVNKMPYGYPSSSQPAMAFNGTLPHQPPPNMGPPMPAYGTMPHDRQFMMGGPMPPHLNQYKSIPPQSLPHPSQQHHVMPPGMHPMQAPMSAPPQSLPPQSIPPQSMPPHGLHMGPPPQQMVQEQDPRFPPHFPPPPHTFPPGVGIQPNGPPMPQNGSFPTMPHHTQHIM